MDKIRWGILGCGKIAAKFAADLKRADGSELVAVASRNGEIARSFAAEHGALHALDNYLDLAQHGEVDAIYIASPHALHHEHTLLCLNRSKAVLCEKAFAMNARQAREMIDTARAKNCFLMEALWTKFLPHYQLVMGMIRKGELGEIRSLLVNFGFKPAEPVAQRLYDPELGGGTLLDIGIYNVFLALSVLGKPDHIEAFMTPAPTGVDEQCAITFTYDNGAVAQLFSTFSSNLATEADINGSSGRIRLGTRFYEPSTSVEFFPGRVDTRQVIPHHREEGWGYQFEIRHMQDCLRKGLTESPVMTHADSLLLMEVLDTIREKAGIRYRADEA
jgi:predicted dehydrogenase